MQAADVTLRRTTLGVTSAHRAMIDGHVRRRRNDAGGTAAGMPPPGCRRRGAAAPPGRLMSSSRVAVPGGRVDDGTYSPAVMHCCTRAWHSSHPRPPGQSRLAEAIVVATRAGTRQHEIATITGYSRESCAASNGTPGSNPTIDRT